MPKEWNGSCPICGAEVLMVTSLNDSNEQYICMGEVRHAWSGGPVDRTSEMNLNWNHHPRKWRQRLPAR